MKKVIYAIAFISAFSAIFSCSKEDYNVSDLQTEQKLVTSQNKSEKSSSQIDTEQSLNVQCFWDIRATAADASTGFCVDQCFTDLNGLVTCPSTTVKIWKFSNTTPTGQSLVTSFTLEVGQPPQVINNAMIDAVGGFIEFSGRAKVQINVNTIAGPNSRTFTPNLQNVSKKCKLPIPTTETVYFGIGNDCSISF